MQMQHNTQKNSKLACHTDMLGQLINMHAVIAFPTNLCSHSIAGHIEAILINVAMQKKQQMAVHEVKLMVVVVRGHPQLRSTKSSKEHTKTKQALVAAVTEEWYGGPRIL